MASKLKHHQGLDLPSIYQHLAPPNVST